MTAILAALARPLAFVSAALLLPSLHAAPAAAQVRRASFEDRGRSLVLEALDDDLVRFEFGSGAGGALCSTRGSASG